MRWLPAVLLLGCSTTVTRFEVTQDVDAAVPGDDAGSDSEVADAKAPSCPQDASATTCVPVATPCAKGVRYGCYAPGCPIGDVGSCTLDSVKRYTDYAEYDEWCCERPACVRSTFGDARCREELDGSLRDGGAGRNMWVCPWSNGRQLATAPGDCVLNGLPGPDVRSTAGEYCCR